MITVVTITWNESYMVPFFLRHYEKIADKIVVYDNESDDGTQELLAKHPKVELRTYGTSGTLKDSEYIRIKSWEFRKMPGEWFVIVDFDEFVWHPNLSSYLDKCTLNGVNYPRVEGYNMIGDAPPIDDGKLLLTDAIKNGAYDSGYSKRCVIHKSLDIQYGPGAHVHWVRGDKKEDLGEIKLLHYSWLSFDYGMARRNRCAARLSQENLAKRWSIHYLDPEGQRKNYELAKKNLIEVIPAWEKMR